MNMKDVLQRLQELDAQNTNIATESDMHRQNYTPEPAKKPGFGSKLASVAKKVGSAITGPNDDELLSKLERETGGKRPAQTDEASRKAINLNPDEFNQLANLPYEEAKQRAREMLDRSSTSDEKKNILFRSLDKLDIYHRTSDIVKLLYNAYLMGQGMGVIREGADADSLAIESMRVLSGIKKTMSECGIETMEGPGMPTPTEHHTPANVSITADNGEELSSMLKDIMSLAGVQKSEPEIAPEEPTDQLSPADHAEPSMKDLIDIVDAPEGDITGSHDEVEDEGMIGGGLGGMAGGTAGEIAGGALGTMVGGPVGGAIGAAAGDIAGTALGAKAGDKMTDEEQSGSSVATSGDFDQVSDSISDLKNTISGAREGAEYSNSPKETVGKDGVTSFGDQDNNLSANKDKMVSTHGDTMESKLFQEYQKFISENKTAVSESAGRLLTKLGDPNGFSAKIYKNEYGEFQIKYFNAGKHMGEDTDGFEGDFDDAKGTAAFELSRLQKRIAMPMKGQMAEGKDEGKPGKNFAKIAKSASKEYGSKAAGERVAGAVRNKLKKAGKL